MTEFGPLEAVCQVCEAPSEGYEVKHTHEKVYPLVPMWDGGPLVSATWELPQFRLTGTEIVLFPCGHSQPRPDLVRFTQREVSP